MLHDLPKFGIAGNVTGHLEQAGEASDFTAVRAARGMPKGMFPTHIPGHATFVGVDPFSPDTLRLPAGPDGARVQAEPELALVLDVAWAGERVERVVPRGFAAYNDASIRKPAPKISRKKNWGPCTKGLSAEVVPLDSLAPGGLLDHYHLTSFLRRGGALLDYGEDSRIADYSLFHEPLLEWVASRLNDQKDEGPLEDLSALVHTRPRGIVVGVGATRYTSLGESDRLVAGDEVIVVVYDGLLMRPERVREAVAAGRPLPAGNPTLVQRVVPPR